jgi:hypothetical protein
MSEDVVVKEEPVVAETAESSVPELSPVEQQAVVQGWMPLEEWKAAGRDEAEHRPAKEFVERGELYKSISSTKRELKNAQAQLSALQRHHVHVFQKAHEQAVRDLRAEKRLAIRNEDFDRLEEIETEIEQLNDQHVKESQVIAATVAPAPAVSPVFQAFVDKNPWYLTDKSLRDEADAQGFIFLNNGGDRNELFAHVEKTMKAKFPDKFGVRRAAPNAVVGANKTNKPAGKAGLTILDVPEDMRPVIRHFCESTGMSEADYIKQLKKNGAI